MVARTRMVVGPVCVSVTSLCVQANRETEELLMAIVKNDVKLVYKKIEEGADVNFVFGSAYSCSEGYTPLMAAAHRGRYECCKALLRSGADPNYCNNADDIVLFWGIDGGAPCLEPATSTHTRHNRRRNPSLVSSDANEAV